MKIILISSLIISFLIVGCKPKKQIVNTKEAKTESSDVTLNKTSGRISHQFRSAGCTSIIIVKQGEKDSLVLIPTEKLPVSVDVNGSEILFNYRTLRIPQPDGCSIGIPADITDIQKKQ